ncbi:MAG: hypothetical protein H6711_11200 [Myxococcales bacterium]|nr:hypothetical protein [Myxococcales bacterium]
MAVVVVGSLGGCSGSTEETATGAATATEGGTSGAGGSGSESESEGDTDTDTGGIEDCVFADPRLEAEVKILASVPEVLSGLWKYGGNRFAESWTFYGVRDLTGIACVAKVWELEHFRCYECPIDDLGPLAAIDEPPLRSIAITGARVKDVDALAGFATLVALDLHDGILEDVDAILAGGADFPDLKVVSFAGNQLGDAIAAPELPALVDLNLAGNHLTRAPDMDGVPGLRWVVLSDNPIAEIGALAALPELEYLELERAELTSIDALVGLPITELRLADNQIVDASPIASMPLEDADLRRNAIVGLAGVESTTIRTLNLADNPLASVAGLRLEAVRELDLSGGQLTSFDGLLWLSGDELQLVAEHNKIVDLSGLAAAPTLERLALSNNPVDLATLPGGLEIGALELNATGITSLEPLSQVSWRSLRAVDNAITALPAIGGPQLDVIDLDLSGNAISDLSPLADLAVFRGSTVALARNAISDLTPLANVHFSSGVILDLADNAITDFSPLATAFLGDGILDLSGNPIASLAPFAFPKSWEDVVLARLATPPDLSPLVGSEAHFRILDLSDNGLTDVSALASVFLWVHRLDLSKNALTEAPSFATWPLEELHLDGNPLTKVGSLPNTVKSFTCAGCSLATLDGALDEAKGLSDVDLSDTPLTSLAALSGHVQKYGTSIRLDRAVNLDFSTLAGLDGSFQISARECGIEELTPFIGRGGADLRGNPIADLGPLVDAQVRGDVFILDEGALDLASDEDALDLFAICAGDLVTIEVGAIRCEMWVEDGV